jgi:hypothetical protein
VADIKNRMAAVRAAEGYAAILRYRRQLADMEADLDRRIRALSEDGRAYYVFKADEVDVQDARGHGNSARHKSTATV